ncbi:MAG: hypothetical protein ACTSP3_02580 [Candidatus Heimdallarchaeaceae archaeon]
MNLKACKTNDDLNLAIRVLIQNIEKENFLKVGFDKKSKIAFIKFDLEREINESFTSYVLIKGDLHANSTFDRKFKERFGRLISSILTNSSELLKIKCIWVWLIFKKDNFSSLIHGGAREGSFQRNFKQKIEDIYKFLKKNFPLLVFKISVFNFDSFLSFFHDFEIEIKNKNENKAFEKLPFFFSNFFEGKIQFIDDY